MRDLLFLITIHFATFQSCNSIPCNAGGRIQSDWTNISPACFGSCNFQNTSCSYSQGCLDSTANKWEIDNECIIMRGRNDFANSFSILESPPIAITETSCLTINASCKLPSSVVVFLSNSSDNELILFKSEQIDVTDLHTSVTLEPAIVRIIVKGRSGGGTVGYVELRSLLLEQGGCDDQGRKAYSCDITSATTTTTAYSFTTISRTNVPSIPSQTWQTKYSGSSFGSPISYSFTRQISHLGIAEYSSSTSGADFEIQGDGDNDVAAIVGSVVSVVIVLILIVIFAILWKRRKQHHVSKDEDDDLEFQKQHPAFIINTERKVTNTVSDVNADGNQHNVYRKGGQVLKTESTNSSIMETKEKHTIMNTVDSNKHTYDLIPGDTTSEMFPGEDSVKKFNCKAETVSNDPLTSPNNGNEFPTSTVNRDDKGNNARSLGQNEQLNCPDVYSKINKTVKKPVANEVYNRLDALKPKVGNFTEDTVMNTYNKLNLVNNPVRNTQNNDFNNGTINSSQNEYNVLNSQQMKCNNVADARNEPSDNCDSKLNIYSSADIHTDTYSRVQNDKKERVITSDYDHIR